MLATTFGLLCLYWILRILINYSVIHIVLATISLIHFLVLPKEFALVPFVIVTAFLAFSLIKHYKNKKEPFRLGTLIGWTSLYVVGGVISVLSIAFFYHDDQVIGHVVLKGKDQSIWTTWKNPSQHSMESGWMPAYEVELQDAKGTKLFSDYVVGDFVGVRAQMILIKWPYQLLGFSNLYRLELVHNGYSTAQRHQFFPHFAYALPFSMKLLEKVWNQLFLGNWQVPGVKSSTLESSYFPLRGAKLTASSREYDLVIGSTGLSARESSAKKTVF